MDTSINIPPNDWQKELPKLKEMAASELIEKVQQQSDVLTSAFCEIAIHAWRARRRMIDKHTEEVREEHKATYRSIESILATLNSVGFALRDREGENYDFGLPEKVIASEKRPGISREIVAETIRPSIFYNDQLIKPGEIIIATPENAEVSKASEARTPTDSEPSNS